MKPAGRLPVEKVAERYRNADIAVVPSLFEGFGERAQYFEVSEGRLSRAAAI